MMTDNFCFYLQNKQIQTSETGGQWYSDTSPYSIPLLHYKCVIALALPLAIALASVVNYDLK